MALFEIRLDTSLVRAARARLNDDDFRRKVRKALGDTASLMEREARIKAKPHGVDTGETARFIESDIGPLTGIASPLWASVSSKQLGVEAIEAGRKPGGRMPPIKPIEDWARRHGMPGAGWAIARGIVKKGTKGLFMFRAAEAVGRKELPERVKKAIEDV